MSEPVWSTGGAGGEHAVTEDLGWAVGVLRTAAADVASVQAELANRWARLELDNGVGQAAAANLARAARVIAPALEGELDDTARRLAAVAHAYTEAERRARHRLSLPDRAREGMQDVAGSQLWMGRVAGAGLLASSPMGVGLLLTGHANVITTALPHDAPPTSAVLNRDSVEAALDTPFYEATVTILNVILTSPILAWLTGWSGSLASKRVIAVPVRSVEDVMRRLLDTEQAPGGALRIERWTGADGVTRRVVFIPGTEDWLGVTDNPFDSKAALEAMLGRLPDSARLITAALAADGAAPGDPVMLCGHSLGGMLATGLAANPSFAQRFNVAALVTAGSPVGRIALPATVNALHLEGTRDIVPGLDGAPNPDTPTRITVHHDARESQLPELDGAAHSIGSAHHLNTYAQTARLVDEGVSASTEGWLSAQREFFSPHGEVVVTEYRP